MSIRIRPYRSGGWEVDIHVRQADGTVIRERRQAPVTSKTAAERWAQARAQELAINGRKPPPKPVAPTLAEFAPRFLDGYVRANRHKPSGVVAKDSIFRMHLLPALGAKRLDAISARDVQRLKGSLDKRSPKTVNNVLAVLGTVLKVAVEWGEIDAMPCQVRLVKLPPPAEASFHDFDEFERLIVAAAQIDPRTHLIVLLGGDAGLRCGEMMALQWPDIDLTRRQLWVRHAEWNGHVTLPKGGRERRVPLTTRLTLVLQSQRHLRGRRVLCHADGTGLNQDKVRNLTEAAVRLAGVRQTGRVVHTLRHTFCSHLAMRGVPAMTIRELAGHKDLATTMRYMHLSPAAIEDGIRLLEMPAPRQITGDILETRNPSEAKSKGFK